MRSVKIGERSVKIKERGELDCVEIGEKTACVKIGEITSQCKRGERESSVQCKDGRENFTV